VRILNTIGSIAETTGGPARSSQGLVAALQRKGIESWLYVFTPGELPWVTGVTFFRAFTQARMAGRAAESSGQQGSCTWDFLRDLVSCLLPKACVDLWRMDDEFDRFVENLKPEIIHIHAIWGIASHVACKIGRKRNIPYIVAPRGMLEPWSLNQKKWKKRLAMWLYQRKDLQRAVALHATAESEAEQFRKLGFKQPIIVSPNGVEFPDSMPSRAFRSDGKKTALFLSRIHPKKGLMELVEAWAEVKNSSKVESGNRDENPITNELMNSRTNELLNWHFEYAGPDYDGHLAQVQKKIRDLGVEADFMYLGNLGDQEKWTAYRRADLFVLPTYSENFGIVIAEALAAEVPVLTTTGTPWKSLVENRCGWWIEPGQKSLVDELPSILQCGREELQVMGRRGQDYAYKTFSWSSIACEMKDAYQWVFKDGNIPSCVRLS